MKLTVFGPPGTGKTYRLINEVAEFLKVYPIDKVAFVSFTRQGAYEGMTRAKTLINARKNKDLPYFRTIHSLCYRECVGNNEILSAKHAEQFEAETALPLFIQKDGTTCGGFFLSEDYKGAYDVIRNNPAIQEKVLEYMNVAMYKRFVDAYETFKSKHKLVDFTDLLIRYVDNGNPLPVSAAIIDEAQDLTPLQWRVVDKMFANAQDIVIAGDDDQAIFSWAGADVDKFLNYTTQQEILDQSYRLPSAIHAYANCISKDILVRKSKTFRPRNEEGSVDIDTFIRIRPNESTLVLARTNEGLEDTCNYLRAVGLPYTIHGQPSVDSKILHAIQRYQAYSNDEIPLEKFMVYSKFFKEDPFKYTDWKDCIDLTPDEIEYYEQVLYHELPEEEVLNPKIRLDTVHASKGAEADHVFLRLQIPFSVQASLDTSPDFENRVYYVGATRARKKLTLILSEGQYSYKIYNPTKESSCV